MEGEQSEDPVGEEGSTQDSSPRQQKATSLSSRLVDGASDGLSRQHRDGYHSEGSSPRQSAMVHPMMDDGPKKVGLVSTSCGL